MSWEDTKGKTCELVSNTTALKTKGYGSTKKDMISFTLGDQGKLHKEMQHMIQTNKICTRLERRGGQVRVGGSRYISEGERSKREPKLSGSLCLLTAGTDTFLKTEIFLKILCL